MLTFFHHKLWGLQLVTQTNDFLESLDRLSLVLPYYIIFKKKTA